MSAATQSTTRARQRWLSILAKATESDLENAWSEFKDKPNYEFVKPPEVGLVQVRARAGGTGREFNFSEATVTRCTVRLESGEIGVGYVSGRSERQSELVAILDGLLQIPKHADVLDCSVVSPLEKSQIEQNEAAQDAIRSTKVDFLTLVRGES